MDLTLSRRGDYVVRSAICLARAYGEGERRKVRQVVEETGVPATFAPQILAALIRAGIAASKAGRDGGYILVRPPQDISLLEVVEAGEGPLTTDRCSLRDGPCRWDDVCPLHETWAAANRQLRETIGATSLASLAVRDAQLASGTYVVPADSHRSMTAASPVEVHVAVHAEASVARRVLGELADTAGAIEGLVQEALQRARWDGTRRGHPPVTATLGRLDRSRRRWTLDWRLLSGPSPLRVESLVEVLPGIGRSCAFTVRATAWRPRAAGDGAPGGLTRLVESVIGQLALAVESAAGSESLPASGSGE